MNITYRFAVENDKDNLRECMLNALEADPNAFTNWRKDYENNSLFWWNSYLEPYLSGKTHKMAIATDSDKFVGMVGLTTTLIGKRQHVGNIVWMWVNADYRGKGIASNLLNMIIEEAKSKEVLKKVTLFVTQKQAPAIKLYEKMGFKECGRHEKELFNGEEYFDFIFMEKFL